MSGISIAHSDVRTDRDRARPIAFAALVAQGCILGLVLSRFHIGTAAFQAALPWLGAASAVQYWLPERWRLQFFAVFSVFGGLTLVVRWPGASWWEEAAAGAILMSLGGAWMAACRVASPRWRILLTIAVALVLSASRSRFDTGVLAAVWPILGGAFMFRSVSFVADTVQDAERGSWARSAAYFFMLPAMFFPLCPVMRWRSFEQDGPNDAAWLVYGRGLRWMARGALQIVCYRALLRHVYVGPGQVLDGATLALHLLANYGLYLHVSGTFHLIVGALHLFGWTLPESNRQYCFAESFTDYWRRVNIYWKEFVLQVVYRPIAFRLRHGGHVRAVTLGSALAFVATWALHGYQNFWVTGAFAFSSRDAVFWGVFALLVLLDARREARDPSRPALNRSASASAFLRKGGRTALVFAVICLLWSLWSADSWAVWFALWTHVDASFAAVLGSALILVALAKAAAEWAAAGKSIRRLGEQRPLAGGPAFAAASIATAVGTTALWVASEPAFVRLLPVPSVVDELRQPRGGTTWPESVSGGYYERLFAAIGSG